MEAVDNWRRGAEEETMACTCGHAEEEHGGDPEFPGSTACQDEDCNCIAFEEFEEDDDGA